MMVVAGAATASAAAVPPAGRVFAAFLSAIVASCDCRSDDDFLSQKVRSSSPQDRGRLPVHMCTCGECQKCEGVLVRCVNNDTVRDT